MLKKTLMTLLCLAGVPLASATVHYDLAGDTLAATVDGEAVPRNVIDMLQRVAARKDPAIRPDAVLHAVIEDGLVARHARQQFPADQLVDANKVGYSPAVQLEQALVADIQAAFGAQVTAAVAREKGGNLDSLISRRRMPVAADWAAVFGAQPKMLLEYALDAGGRQAASKVPLLVYRIDSKAAGKISLLDVYEAQNVQGRQRLHDHDADFAMEQAKLLLQRRYVLRWAQTRSPLGDDGYRAFVRAVQDHMVHDRFVDITGVSNDVHEHNPHLSELAAAATPEEVRAYYDSHRDQFRRIEKVHARHIRSVDESATDAVYARIQKGEDFASLARSESIADDKAQGGDLGWIVHDEKSSSWIDSLAFVQKAGVASKPFRSPGKPGENPAWEILLTDERVEGFQAPDSSSVRYVAAQAIAREKALAEYRDTLQRIWNEADVHISPALQPTVERHPGVLK